MSEDALFAEKRASISLSRENSSPYKSFVPFSKASTVQTVPNICSVRAPVFFEQEQTSITARMTNTGFIPAQKFGARNIYSPSLSVQTM